jgi:2-(1,2-epoxy-1,2-dihydrophenyl)acetyl-CoA isomerase
MLIISEKEYKEIIFKMDSGVCKITLNRPNKLNALHYRTLMEILDVFEFIRKDRTVRVITINGAGRAFCSGDDLHHKLIYLIREIRIPVIALLHGICLGAGFELALACDFRLAADNLEIGDHRTTRAMCMLHGASWFLPKLIGFAKATEIVLTGKHLNAGEALEIGLVNKVYPTSQFYELSEKFIQKIAEMPTKCLGYNKAMLNYSIINDLPSCLENEFLLFTENMKTSDFREGNRSFLEKREPQFKGK